MDRIIYFAAIFANLAQMALAGYLVLESYGRDNLVAALLFLPPIISSVALHFSPDHEERRLTRKLRKAQLRKELEKLGG